MVVASAVFIVVVAGVAVTEVVPAGEGEGRAAEVGAATDSGAGLFSLVSIEFGSFIEKIITMDINDHGLTLVRLSWVR